jgi:predicted RNA binding protein YcfA (HicA-like mRNA interferase family)
MTVREFKKLISNKGFVLLRQSSGSHEQWGDGIKRVTIAVHSGDIPKKTLNTMLKQAGLK